ncbi:MAG TPA: 3'-5' exonuclease [Kofleriaceae bacterium]
MEGTLSLFDWRPAPAPAPEVRPRAPTIIVFDCETTGIDFTRDQVIELCVQHGLEAHDSGATSQTWRIKPAVPIHPAAQAVHGITPADLAECPPFAAFADEIAAVFASADVIIGYNLSFDIDMLQAEYARLSKPPLELAGKQIVDAFRLWQQCESRSLQHAHRRFVGDEFAAAHSASADVAATGRVLVGMLHHFNLHEQDWGSIASVCDPGRASWVGPSRHLRWENEVIVLGFGKHIGAPVHELAAGPDRSFLQWVIGKDFPPHVAEICRAALEHPADGFVAWARTRFGQAAPTAQPPFAAQALVSASIPSPPPKVQPAPTIDPSVTPITSGKKRRARNQPTSP